MVGNSVDKNQDISKFYHISQGALDVTLSKKIVSISRERIGLTNKPGDHASFEWCALQGTTLRNNIKVCRSSTGSSVLFIRVTNETDTSEPNKPSPQA